MSSTDDWPYEMTPTTKKRIALLRAAFGLTLLVVLLSRLDPKQLYGAFKDLHLGYLVLAFVFQAVAKVLWTLRWRDILTACGMQRRFGQLFTWLFIGLFFNNFLPTAVGGDLVRGYYAAKDSGGMSTSFMALLAERVLGLITLAAMAAFASMAVLLNGEQLLPTHILLLICGTGVIATLLGLVFLTWQGLADKIDSFPSFGSEKIAKSLNELGQALKLFHRPTTPKLRIVASSMALQVTAVFFYIASARAVGIDLPATLFFFVVPASVIVAMLPLSLNGLGLREGTLIGLVTAHGAPIAASGAFALLALAVSTFYSLIGGVVYLGYRNPVMKTDAHADAG